MGENNEQQTRSRVSPQDIAQKLTKGSKVAGIIVAILMIIVGILMFIRPVVMVIAIEYLATIGFVIYGIYQIFMYCQTPKEARNGWMIANGIIFAILGILILVSGMLNVMMTFSFILGFLALFGGISQLAASGMYKENKGWVIASGIINLFLGLFMLISPFVATIAVDYILAIYLIVGGIAMFALACSYSTKK